MRRIETMLLAGLAVLVLSAATQAADPLLRATEEAAPLVRRARSVVPASGEPSAPEPAEEAARILRDFYSQQAVPAQDAYDELVRKHPGWTVYRDKIVNEFNDAFDRVPARIHAVYKKALGPEGEPLTYEQIAEGVVQTSGDDRLDKDFGANFRVADPAKWRAIVARVRKQSEAIQENKDYILANATMKDAVKAANGLYGDINADLMAAVKKIAGDAVGGKNRYGVFSKDGGRGVFTKEQALADLRAAGLLEEAELPAAIGGFAVKDESGLSVMGFIRSWYGEEGLAKFQRHLAVADGGSITLYSLPMLEAWVAANEEALDRIVRKGWVQMPIEKASLWASQELAITKSVPTEDLLQTTPNALYVRRGDYPAFMSVYRPDKSALQGEDIAGAIKEFQTALIAKLEEMRQAQLAQIAATRANTAALNAGMNGLSRQIGGVRSAIGVSTLTGILLHFIH